MESVAAAVGLAEASLRIIKTLKKAYERMKDAPETFEKYTKELKAVKAVIEVIDDEPQLHTENICAEVEKIKRIEEKLKAILISMKAVAEKTGSKPLAGFGHQLTQGRSVDQKLSNIMADLVHAKMLLCLLIQTSSVGIIGNLEDKLVARLDVIQSVHAALLKASDQKIGLRIMKVLKDRPPGKDGTVVLRKEDIKYLERSDDVEGEDEDSSEKVREVRDCTAKDDGIQLNAPVDGETWVGMKRVTVCNNVATGSSVQVNYSMRKDVIKDLMSFKHDLKVKEMEITWRQTSRGRSYTGLSSSSGGSSV